MRDAGRFVSLGLFVLVFACFALPFARISCDRKEVVTASGYEVAFGKEFETPTGSEGGTETREAEPDYVAIGCLVVAAVGVGLVLVRGRRGALARVHLGWHGLLLVLALWAELWYRVRASSAVLQMLAGYWAVLALFAASVVVNLFPILRRQLPAP